MDFIKITQIMFDFYREKEPSVLNDAAIIDQIKKDVESGKLQKEFSQLAQYTYSNFYKGSENNVFGYGFANKSTAGLELEKTAINLGIKEEEKKVSAKDLSPAEKNKILIDFVKKIIKEQTGTENLYFVESAGNTGNVKDYCTEIKNDNDIKVELSILKYTGAETLDFNFNINNRRFSIYSDQECFSVYINNDENGEYRNYDYDYNGNLNNEYIHKSGEEGIFRDYKKEKQEKELIQLSNDLTKKDSLGRNIVVDIIPNDSISNENILDTMKKYYDLTGRAMNEDINASSAKLFKEDIDKKFRNAITLQDKFNNFESFLKYGGLDNFLKKDFNDYSVYTVEWEKITGRKSFEADFAHFDLDINDREKYLSIINKEVDKIKASNEFEANKTKNNEKIENEYYKSKNIYDVQFGDYMEPIVIKNKTTGAIREIKPEIFSEMSQTDKVKIWDTLQYIPAEALEDFAIEIKSLQGHSGNEIYVSRRHINGEYVYWNENTIVNSKSILTVIHELGHAVDFNYYDSKYSNSANSSNTKFNDIFNKEIGKYIQNGNKRFSKEEVDSYFDNNGNYAYCTYNEKEMFAECYSLLMLGYCNSKEAILTHFPECLAATKRLLNEIRKMPDNIRLQKEI